MSEKLKIKTFIRNNLAELIDLWKLKDEFDASKQIYFPILNDIEEGLKKSEVFSQCFGCQVIDRKNYNHLAFILSDSFDHLPSEVKKGNFEKNEKTFFYFFIYISFYDENKDQTDDIDDAISLQLTYGISIWCGSKKKINENKDQIEKFFKENEASIGKYKMKSLAGEEEMWVENDIYLDLGKLDFSKNPNEIEKVISTFTEYCKNNVQIASIIEPILK